MLAKLAAAALAVAVCGCAATPPVTTAAAPAGKGTYYCWKDKLATEADALVCNWEASARDACSSTGVVTLKKSTIASGPRNATLCNNGQWLVAVTTQ